MEKFSVGGERLREFYSPETILADIFRDIEKELAESEMVVCQYIINGLALSETDEFRFAKIKLSEVQTFEYLAEKTGSLVQNVISGWIDGLPELIRAAEEFAEETRRELTKLSLKRIHDLLENCNYLTNSIDSIRALLGNQAGGIIIPWEQTLEQLKAACFSAFKFVESQDLKSLANALEYDLPHNLQCLLEHLEDFDAFLFGEQNIGKRRQESLRKAKGPLGRRKTYN